MEHLYALIMAGGGGTRLWPASRAAQPKQFIRLVGRRSLVQIAFDRVTPLIPPDRVLVVTGERYAPLVREQLPTLPADNVVVEPAGRNTAPAIGLGAVHLLHRDRDAVLAVLTADHVMRRDDTFRAALGAAAAVCGDRIVTLGITPAGPETGYGYIERGEPLGESAGWPLYRAARFREKPDRATAEQYLASGRFYWNSGMFIWRASTVLTETARQMPDLHAALVEIGGALGTPAERSVTEAVWAGVKPISIDYGVMEGARDIAVLPVDPGWNDVGSWSAVHQESLAAEPDPAGNVVQGGELLALDSTGCLVRSDKLVAAVGLRDLVIVETDDAILICPRGQAQRARDVVEQLKATGRESLL